MGRKRKDGDPHGLAGTRLYHRNGQYFYVHRGTARWEACGAVVDVAKKRAAIYNADGGHDGSYGTVAYWLGEFLGDCRARVKAGAMSARTLADYEGYTAADGPLAAFFGAMLPEQIAPAHVQSYLEAGANLGRGTQANRERACLSSMLSWLIRNGKTAMPVNPCMRASGVRRNPEKKRERYVSDEEYRAVYAAGGRSVRLMMELVYRTLQRPEVDVLAWTPANIRAKADGRVLRFTQSKTGRQIDIGLVGQLEQLVRAAVGEVPQLRQAIVHNLAGQAYSYSGISAMLKKAIAKVRREHAKRGGPLATMESFGYRDLKGKGATDMYLSGVAIEQIQRLCGHADKATTEIYIKQRWRETANPNELVIGGLVKVSNIQ